MVTNSRVFFYARGCGCNGHPAFPAPLIFEGHEMQTSDASRRENAEVCLKNASTPHSRSSSPATGSRECAPDDRLQRAIQYSEASVIEAKVRGVLDTPLSRSMTDLL